MPQRPSQSDDEHVVEVTKTEILKEVFHANEEFAVHQDKMAQAYDLKMNVGGKAAEIQAALKMDPSTFTGTRLVLHQWLSWWAFDTMIGLVILANAVVIGMESQARAWMPLGCSMDCDCKDQVDPTLVCTKPSIWLTIVDYCFYAVYLLELVLRFAVYGIFVLKSHWVKFDTFLVTASTLDIVLNLVSTTEVLNQVMLVRLLRLARLARALRLMVQFQTLWQLVQGLFHSIGTLFWTFLLVMLLMYIAAVTGMELIKVDPELPVDHPYNEAAALCFRDTMDAILTLLQVFSFDSIGGIYRPLVKQNYFCFIYFVLAMLILSIALMNLVTAVMVNSSLDQASQDKEAKQAWEAARKAKQMESLKKMFLELDEDGSGELSLEELLEAPESAQDQLKEIAGSGDLEELFQLLDYDGGGTVGVEEFCEGVLKASSSAPGAIELTSLVKQCAEILKNSREAFGILSDGKALQELARRGGVDSPGTPNSSSSATGTDPAGIASAVELEILGTKVSKVESDMKQVQANISEIMGVLHQRADRRHDD